MEDSNSAWDYEEGQDLSEKQLAFIERQNHCPLCGSHLLIRVESYLEDFMLREEAHCDTCDVLARVKDHKMH
jgi:hypothetical protein